jgi:hypothetical protein
MRLIPPSRCLIPLVLALSMALISCGGGTNTAGGGSGIGGTGISTVTGNVSQVITDEPEAAWHERPLGLRVLAGAINWLSAPVNAESAQLAGIQVFGGGGIATTGDDGSFTLEEVAPSENFVLNFVLDDTQIALSIGRVPAGSRVEVRNIVVNAAQGFATAEDVEVEENATTMDDGTGNASRSAGSQGSPGKSQTASNNNKAGTASPNSSPNSSQVANNASSNNSANNASSGANAGN